MLFPLNKLFLFSISHKIHNHGHDEIEAQYTAYIEE